MRNNRTLTVLCLITILLSTACGVRNFEDYNGFLALKSGRLALLTTRLDNFHKQIEFGNYSKNRPYIDHDLRNKFDSKLGIKSRDVKISEIVVEDVDVDMDSYAYDAKATVVVQSYKAPSYVVQDQYYLETWEFRRFSGGWILTGLEKTTAPVEDEEDLDADNES
jgi:hypothetical protein